MIEESNEEVYVGHLFKSKGQAKVEDEADTAQAAHHELQEIVNHLVKLPGEEAPVKAVKIARITHHEISAMRITQSNMPAMKVEEKTKIKGSALIQTFDAFMGLFKHQEKRTRCLVEGHECKHCGQIVKVENRTAATEVPKGH